MSYTITNTNNNIRFTLNSNSTNYSNLYLRVYVNGSVHQPYYTAVPSTEPNQYIFTIYGADFNVGDTITKMELVQDGSIKLWQTHEGIVWLIDGEEVANTSTNTYTVQLEDNDPHTIQAVYVGNNSLKMSYTDVQTFRLPTTEVDESGSLDNDGAYKLEFVDNKTEYVYHDAYEIKWRLTKGGVPVDGKVVQMQPPSGSVVSANTHNGITKLINDHYEAGKFKIGAFFQDPVTKKRITSTYRDIEIKKGTPTITDNFEAKGDYVVGSKYQATFKYNKTPFNKVKVSLYVNGKLINKTTTQYGNIYYKFPSKGTFKIKTVYKGNKNLNKVELERTITIK